ncbi:MAG: NAD(P)H-dependent oxidoreductase [Thermicanus sp.]|nr:NAD(P)H-dependent oxidoreductase [Thermicanus sp.]
MSRLLVIYYSAYGHIYKMAKAAAEGARDAGSEVRICRIPEFDSERNRTPFLDQWRKEEDSELSRRFKTVDRFSAYEKALELQKEIPIATNDDLRWADGIVWGFPTRYGSMPAQVKLFLEFASDLLAGGVLEGKPAGIITSAGSIHTGHESTLLTAMVPLFHFGMLIVGLPYSENLEYLTADPIGGSPYGASTLAGPDGSMEPEERELLMAKRLGKRVANAAAALHSVGFLKG